MAELSSGGSDATTNRLLAALLVRDLARPDGVSLLARLGVLNEDIAAVFNTTEASVRATASRARRAGKKDAHDE